MARIMKILLGICLFVVSAFAAPNYDCRTMIHLGRTADDAHNSTCPAASMVDKLSYRSGEKVTVTFTTSQPITTFMLQARMPVGDDYVPQGTWEVNTSNLLTTHKCVQADDTIISIGFNPTRTFSAIWVAPTDEMVTQVEFVASVANADGDFWVNCHSILIERNKEAAVDPTEEEVKPPTDEKKEPANPEVDVTDQNEAKEDLHDGKQEEEQALLWQEKMAKLTDAEDAASEGDWTKKQEEDRKMHEQEIHDEMMEYEERLAREEEERRARIRMEILDKEEWEAEQRRKDKLKPGAGNENEVGLNEERGIVVGDGDSGASAFAVSLTLVVLSLFAYCLP